MSAFDLAELRWRLILGRYAGRHLRPEMDAGDRRRERALDYLYGREYAGRGVRGRESTPRGNRGGSLDPSQLTVPKWLSEVRELFPRETMLTIEKHALERYELHELVTDKATLEKLEPNEDLLKCLLSFKGQMQGEVLETARRLIRKIVEDLKEKLAREVRASLAGRLNRLQRSPLQVSQNFDWRGTLRANLKHYQPEQQRLVLQRAHFFARTRRQLPWRIILVVDQSGSMIDAVIHSAVLAGILAGLPAVDVKLVVFDTSVVDLSSQVGDPVEVLMSVQLGGGTDIGQALAYAERLVEIPQRTVLALITDFCEGAPPKRMLTATKRLHEAGVVLLGLTALDPEAQPVYDETLAAKMAALGMDVTAATPRQFAQWLAKRMT
jgi:predicted metal-dependent peptidase